MDDLTARPLVEELDRRIGLNRIPEGLRVGRALKDCDWPITFSAARNSVFPRTGVEGERT